MPIHIEFDVANDEYRAWIDNGVGDDDGDGVVNAGNGVQDSDEPYFNEMTLTNDIEFDTGNATAAILGFNSRALPATSVGSVYIKNSKSGYRKIILSTAGNIRVEKSSDGTTWN